MLKTSIDIKNKDSSMVISNIFGTSMSLLLCDNILGFFKWNNKSLNPFQLPV